MADRLNSSLIKAGIYNDHTKPYRISLTDGWFIVPELNRWFVVARLISPGVKGGLNYFLKEALAEKGLRYGGLKKINYVLQFIFTILSIPPNLKTMRKLLCIRNMMMTVLVILTSCTKSSKEFDKQPAADLNEAAVARKPGGGGGGSTQTFRTYTIQQGNHSCDQSTFASVSGITMSFIAKFDSSCIYTSIDPVNQWDINKLWGFNESLFSTANSARVGWNWRDGALRLRPYTHVNGVASMDPPEVIVPIGAEIPCSITVQGNTYIFVINGTTITMPRGLSSSKFSGYQLYPYFGGDEVAPHLITILIK